MPSEQLVHATAARPEDFEYMQRALRQAARGVNITSPNPSVGCVLVKDGHVVGEGHTQPAGQAHAEVMALRAAGEAAAGATAYVTLEPCSHFGRTPPCADALVKAGVKRVVVASGDPNPLVAGQGLSRLDAAGIATTLGVLENEAREHHRGFISRMTRGRPWLRLKAAATLDGKTGLLNGESKWITGPAARADVQRLRARSCAMLTGVGTILADDPQLTVRELDSAPWHGRQPLRVVLDSHLRIPPHARLFEVPGVLIACAEYHPERAAMLTERGAEVFVVPGAGGQVHLPQLLTELGTRGINELTVEAGAGLNGALLAAGLVDEIVLYLAPKLMGDHARGLFAMPELERMDEVRSWRLQDVRQVGEDIRLMLRPSDTR